MAHNRTQLTTLERSVNRCQLERNELRLVLYLRSGSLLRFLLLFVCLQTVLLRLSIIKKINVYLLPDKVTIIQRDACLLTIIS